MTAAPGPILAVDGLCKSYGTLRAVQEVSEPRIGKRIGQLCRRDAAHVPVAVVVDDDAVSFHGRYALERRCDGLLRPKDVRRVECHGLVLDPADRCIQVLQVHVLRQDPESTPPREGRGLAGRGTGARRR